MDSSKLQYPAENTNTVLLQLFSILCSLDCCSHLGNQKKQPPSLESRSLQVGGKEAGKLYKEVDDSQQSFRFLTVKLTLSSHHFVVLLWILPVIISLPNSSPPSIDHSILLTCLRSFLLHFLGVDRKLLSIQVNTIPEGKEKAD